MLGGIKVNENLRKRYNMEIMQLLGDLDVLSFVRTSRLNWICHLNRMDSKRQESRVFHNNPQGSRLRGQPNNRRRNCVCKTDINGYKFRNWKESSKTEMTGRI